MLYKAAAILRYSNILKAYSIGVKTWLTNKHDQDWILESVLSIAEMAVMPPFIKSLLPCLESSSVNSFKFKQFSEPQLLIPQWHDQVILSVTERQGLPTLGSLALSLSSWSLGCSSPPGLMVKVQGTRNMTVRLWGSVLRLVTGPVWVEAGASPCYSDRLELQAGFSVVSPHVAPAPHLCPWRLIDIGVKLGGE